MSYGAGPVPGLADDQFAAVALRQFTFGEPVRSVSYVFYSDYALLSDVRTTPLPDVTQDRYKFGIRPRSSMSAYS